MLKWLIGLSIAQTVAIGFLAVRVMDMGGEIEARAPVIADAAPFEAAFGAAPALVQTASAPGASGVGAEDIRRIVREEVAALALRAPGAAQAAPARAADPVVAEGVRRDLDLYLSRGRISPSEMAGLQTKMAGLPPAERTEILRKLTKAMNAGRLDGEL